MNLIWSLLYSVLIATAASWTASAQTGSVDPEEFRRIPPKSPEEELAHLHIKPGFRLELVVSEPLVEDPVAICFDEHRRLFVVELHDHQHLPDPRTSKVKMLTDKDGDGRYDTATVLADGLSWVTAIAPWDGGVFIGASPNLIYLKDTDGDGRADIKETILTGFDHDKNGTISKSYHHERSLNNFNWAPGNRYFCAGGMNGGFVKNLVHPDAPPMALRKLDFSFDPLKRLARPETGSSQHGMAIDDWGNRYQTTNSNPVLFPSYDLRYRLRNPGAALPPAMASIAQPNSKGPVFRRSGTEPWREARTRLRAAGLERGPVEQGGTVSGYFTGTADSAIYKGALFPSEYYGDLFVGEVSENVVHHRKIHFPDDQVEPVALRPDDEPDYEFIASSDNWFRPVQTVNGPGGALYICDMYREVVEAWHTIPEYIREHLDRDSGKDLGRIWRVVPEGRGASKDFELGDAGTPELVAALDSPDGWVRDTASRLLYQRQDLKAMPLLEEKSGSLLAVYALDGLGALQKQHVIPLLKAPEPGLRIHALRLLEQLPGIPIEVIAGLVDDPDPRVLYQLAFSLGEYPVADRQTLLPRIARRFPEDDWLAKAVASSAGEEVLPELVASGDITSAAVLAACREAGRLKVPLPGLSSDRKSIPALKAYGDGLRSAKSALSKMLPPETVSALRSRCRESIADGSLPDERRASWLELIGLLGFQEKDVVAAVLPLFSPGVSDSLQTAAESAFRTSARSEAAGKALVEVLPETSARIRPTLIQLMTRRVVWCRQLLGAVETKTIPAMEIPAASGAFLRRHSDTGISILAAKLLPAPPDRSRVVAEFQGALLLTGDSKKGEAIFRNRCLICHQLTGEGGQVGPATGEFQKHGKGQILMNLLDPNKTVQPDYIGFLLSTQSGEAAMGRVVEDTGASVTIRDVAGNDRNFSRSQIASFVSTGRSLMPEGIEAGLGDQAIADLLEFITTYQ